MTVTALGEGLSSSDTAIFEIAFPWVFTISATGALNYTKNDTVFYQVDVKVELHPVEPIPLSFMLSIKDIQVSQSMLSVIYSFVLDLTM